MRATTAHVSRVDLIVMDRPEIQTFQIRLPSSPSRHYFALSREGERERQPYAAVHDKEVNTFQS